MKTRTSFYLSGKGIVFCACGTITDFCRDINDFIIPILEDSITAKFNNATITVLPYDNANTLYDKLWKALGGK